MERRGDRPTNLDMAPLAGRWIYTDFPGAEPVEVHVAIEDGITLVRFPPRDGDEGVELLFFEMAAAANWKEHFARMAE
jgi:hypothetical protein